jgi:hypothetical protein
VPQRPCATCSQSGLQRRVSLSARLSSPGARPLAAYYSGGQAGLGDGVNRPAALRSGRGQERFSYRAQVAAPVYRHVEAEAYSASSQAGWQVVVHAERADDVIDEPGGGRTDEPDHERLMRCPRCYAEEFPTGKGALSRTVRDDGVAIEVCPSCGERETLDGDDSGEQITFTAWPVPVEQLVDEDLRLIEIKRRPTAERTPST